MDDSMSLTLRPLRSFAPSSLVQSLSPPGRTSQLATAAVACASLALLFLLGAATLGYGDELPNGVANGHLAFRLMTHKSFLALAALATLVAPILGVAGWKRNPVLCSLAILESLACVGLVAWALFVNG
jgi:hypothetical protein